MAVITFPATLGVARFNWGLQRRDLSFASAFGSQAVEISSPLWAASVQFDPAKRTALEVGAWQALLLKLRGKVNQLALWHIARPIPIGSMRGAMTLNAAAAQGATSLSVVAAGQNLKTLLAGDYIGLGDGIAQQVVMVTDDATADAAGLITVNIQPPLRSGFALGAAVVWDKPKALFRVTGSDFSADYSGSLVTARALDLIEDWRA